ncbi:MAG: S49 family peptidase [Variibacter sp.]
MIDLPFVATRVFGTPLMVARAKLEVILGVLGPRLTGKSAQPIEVEQAPEPTRFVTPEGIAVVPVIGTLVSRSSYLAAASGLVSYGEAADMVAAAFDDPAVRGIVLEIDSPGGEVGGLFDLVDHIGALKSAHGKPLWAVASECALSAAYAIASVADRVYVTQTGEVGSVGVVAVHVDESGADAKAGLAWTFIFAGDRKIDGNAHQSLSEPARNDIQADVDRLYEQLVALVAGNRGLSAEAVRGTEAAIYRGKLGTEIGFADRVGTVESAISDLTDELGQSEPRRTITYPNNKRSPSMAKSETEQAGDSAADVHSPTQEHVDPAPSPPAPAAAVAPAAALAGEASPTAPVPHEGADRLRAEFSEIAAVAAQAHRLGVSVDAADAMSKGIKPDALRRSVLDALAARAEATSVIAAAPSTPAAGDSPIVRRAKERAATARA